MDGQHETHRQRLGVSWPPDFGQGSWNISIAYFVVCLKKNWHFGRKVRIFWVDDLKKVIRIFSWKIKCFFRNGKVFRIKSEISGHRIHDPQISNQVDAADQQSLQKKTWTCEQPLDTIRDRDSWKHLVKTLSLVKTWWIRKELSNCWWNSWLIQCAMRLTKNSIHLVSSDVYVSVENPFYGLHRCSLGHYL